MLNSMLKSNPMSINGEKQEVVKLPQLGVDKGAPFRGQPGDLPLPSLGSQSAICWNGPFVVVMSREETWKRREHVYRPGLSDDTSSHTGSARPRSRSRFHNGHGTEYDEWK